MPSHAYVPDIASTPHLQDSITRGSETTDTTPQFCADPSQCLHLIEMTIYVDIQFKLYSMIFCYNARYIIMLNVIPIPITCNMYKDKTVST